MRSGMKTFVKYLLLLSSGDHIPRFVPLSIQEYLALRLFVFHELINGFKMVLWICPLATYCYSMKFKPNL